VVLAPRWGRALAKGAGLVSDERIELLLSWRRSGFSVHNAVTLESDDPAALERLARYLLRPPVSLARTRWDEDAGRVRYAHKDGHDRDGRPDAENDDESFDPLEFLARVLVHVPAPRLHLTRYYGAYSNLARGLRRRASTSGEGAAWGSRSTTPPDPPDPDTSFEAARRSELRKRWADLLRRVYEADPLLCPHCGSTMRIVAVITERTVIRKILDHLKNRQNSERAPPTGASAEPPN
jgi:hypothetical protein